MASLASGLVVRQLESLFAGGSVVGLSDRQLLDRFTAQRDAGAEAAFAALVRRHGPMVLGVCSDLLGDRHHAEDAFQAVFLILAQKARAIRDPDLLGNWLYGVALRTSRCAKLRLAQRCRNEEAGALVHVSSRVTVPSAEQSFLAGEQAEMLQNEIERLPRAFRLPVVLCYFEGLTVHEAARRLGCSHGTVRSRMARAREKLRRGLTRRGVALPAATLAAALSTRTASASVSSHLCETTARAAIDFAAGQSAAHPASALALEVLKSMSFYKLKFLGLTLLLLCTVATSAGYLNRAPAMTGEPTSPAAGQRAPIAANPVDANKQPAPGRMFVVGRVLDPEGKPVPGATVMATARAKLSASAVGLERLTHTVIAHMAADGSGRFRLDAPRTSSSRNDEFMAIAVAPGYGVGWAKIDPDADQPAAEISLQPEQVIQGRLFDMQGRPATGVMVCVSSIRRELVHDSGRQVVGRVSSEGPIFLSARVKDVPGWPQPATTDASGRFALRGVGRGRHAQLSVADPRFAFQVIDVETDGTPGAKLFTNTLQSPKIFTGHVTYADTGKPVPNARLQISAVGPGLPGSRQNDVQADAGGRFRVNASAGERFGVSASPPAGQIYLAVHKRVEWPKGAVEQSVDFALPRGIAIRGKVVEEGSSRPVEGALVTFRPSSRMDGDSSSGIGESVTATDGSFELAVAPHAGNLGVHAPNEDYVLREIGTRQLADGQPGGRRLYSHGSIACDPKPSGPVLEIQVALRRGVTVSGRIVGPDDQPVQDAWIISRAALQPSPTAWRRWRGHYHGQALSGRFELHGLDADTDLPVYFLEPKRKLGATAHLSGKSVAGGPIAVKLEPCGSALARLIDADRRPLAGYRDMYLIWMIVTPGPAWASRDPADAKRLSADGDLLARIDPINFENEPVSDAQGRIAFPALIPGARYRIVDQDPSGPRVRKDFTAKPGETLDLGDITIQNPAR